MKRNNKTLACLLAGLTAAAQTAPAITTDNPYTSAITNRNLFSLKTAAEMAPPVTPLPPPNIPKVMLTGLTTLMGGKRCILRVPVPARGQTPAKEISLFKSEQDPTEEGISVLEIDLVAAKVKINNNGTEQTLDLTKDAPKSAPVAAPLPAPGIAVPKPMAALAPQAAAPQQREIRGAGPAFAPPVNDPNAASGAGVGNQPQRQALSLEDQTVMIEANRIATQDLVDRGELPPLPPTDLTDMLKDEQNAIKAP